MISRIKHFYSLYLIFVDSTELGFFWIWKKKHEQSHDQKDPKRTPANHKMITHPSQFTDQLSGYSPPCSCAHSVFLCIDEVSLSLPPNETIWINDLSNLEDCLQPT